MKNYFDYELADALQELEYEEDVISQESLRPMLMALLDKITKLETSLRNHGHDGFNTY